MLVKNFHDLPQELQCEEVRPYFEILNQRRTSLLCKSIFDRVIAAGMLITFESCISCVSHHDQTR